MPSITPMMSTIFFADSLIELIVSTTCDTTEPPFRATSDAVAASLFASRALSAFCFTVEVSSSIADAVFSSALACISVRDDRSILPSAISREAVPMVSVPTRTWPTMPTRLLRISFISASRLELSDGWVWMPIDRSPLAMLPAIDAV
ncbi:hypothetical protein JAB2_49860 [Janthinobacterium sp. HH100]|nr:hypothetical protein JAB2_49860 [Janthinobacterium sp. HH100]